MNDSEKFPYGFQIIGNLEEKGFLIDQIVQELGVFDTKEISYPAFENIKKLFKDLIIVNTFSHLSDYDYSGIENILDRKIEVSGKWTLRTISGNNNFNITIINFKNRSDMEKYNLYHNLGDEYIIME